MASAPSRAAAAALGTTAATASPTKRTWPVARMERGAAASGEPSGRLKGRLGAIGLTSAFANSSPVITATTRRRSSAGAVSIEAIRAWACGERERTCSSAQAARSHR